MDKITIEERMAQFMGRSIEFLKELSYEEFKKLAGFRMTAALVDNTDDNVCLISPIRYIREEKASLMERHEYYHGHEYEHNSWCCVRRKAEKDKELYLKKLEEVEKILNQGRV